MSQSCGCPRRSTGWAALRFAARGLLLGVLLVPGIAAAVASALLDLLGEALFNLALFIVKPLGITMDHAKALAKRPGNVVKAVRLLVTGCLGRRSPWHPPGTPFVSAPREPAPPAGGAP